MSQFQFAPNVNAEGALRGYGTTQKMLLEDQNQRLGAYASMVNAAAQARNESLANQIYASAQNVIPHQQRDYITANQWQYGGAGNKTVKVPAYYHQLSRQNFDNAIVDQMQRGVIRFNNPAAQAKARSIKLAQELSQAEASLRQANEYNQSYSWAGVPLDPRGVQALVDAQKYYREKYREYQEQATLAERLFYEQIMAGQ